MKEAKDFLRLWKASKITTLTMVGLETFLGLFVVLELGVLSGTVDSVLGARSVGVWTSDVAMSLNWQIALVFILILTLHFKEQFSGVARELGKKIRESVFIGATFLASIVSAPVWLILLLAGYLLIVLKPIENKLVRVLYSVLAIGVAYCALNNLLHMTVARAISVGDLIWWGGALMAFVGFVALRLHIVPNKLKS